jgi:hypothetical protein
MRVSSLLGLSVGWLITSLGMAFDVGADDRIFFPTLALGLPAVLGLIMSVRAFRKASPREPLMLSRLIGFGILGVVLMTAVTLGLIAIFYWGQSPQT